ncbi:MAG: SPFH domain-containing protein [Vicinamibacteria bacterium]
MTLGELFKELIEWLYGLWPMRIVVDWEQGIRMLNGNARALLTSTNGWFGTGIHSFVPLLGDIISEEVNIEVTETDLQTHITLDKIDATFSLAIKYRIRDLKSLYLKVHDAHDTLQEEIRSAAGAVAAEMKYEDMAAGFGEAVATLAKKQMYGWGVDVMSVRLVNLTSAQTIRLITDSPVVIGDER